MNNKFLGFTLAEVLITIGIIGVVSAITIPNLLTNVRNKDLQAQLKKNIFRMESSCNAIYERPRTIYTRLRL